MIPNKPSERHENGTRVLIEEISTELEKSGLSQRDRLMLRSLRYMLEEIPVTRGDIYGLKTNVAILEKNNIVLQAKKNPKSAAMIGILILTLNSLVNWAGIRRPILQAIIHMTTGILVPLESLP